MASRKSSEAKTKASAAKLERTIVPRLVTSFSCCILSIDRAVICLVYSPCISRLWSPPVRLSLHDHVIFVDQNSPLAITPYRSLDTQPSREECQILFDTRHEILVASKSFCESTLVVAILFQKPLTMLSRTLVPHKRHLPAGYSTKCTRSVVSCDLAACSY